MHACMHLHARFGNADFGCVESMKEQFLHHDSKRNQAHTNMYIYNHTEIHTCMHTIPSPQTQMSACMEGTDTFGSRLISERWQECMLNFQSM
jgi:hypothetical protein